MQSQHLAHRFLTALAALLLAAPLSLAAAPQARPVELSWHLVQGQTARYLVRTAQTSVQVVDGREYETRQDLSVYYTLAVQEQDVVGVFIISCRYERVVVELEQMLLGRVSWDSQSAEDQLHNGEPSVAPFLALLGKRFTFAMRPDGTVPAGSLRGFDKIREAVLAPLAGQQLVHDAYAPAYSDEAMRALLERSFHVLPDAPKRPGERWRRTVDQPIPLLGTLRFDTAFELAGVEEVGGGRVARIRLATRLSEVPAKRRGAAAKGEEAEELKEEAAPPLEVTLVEGKGSGEALFDLGRGWLRTSRIDSEMVLDTRVSEAYAPADGPGARSARVTVRQRLTLERLP